MKKQISITLFVLAFFTSISAAAEGDKTVGWWNLEKRTIETGESYDILSFYVVYESQFQTQWVTSDHVESVTLYENVTAGNPTGDQVIGLPAYQFQTYEIIYAQHDPDINRWYYSDFLTTRNSYEINLQALSQGTYRLVVTFDDGTSPAYDSSSRGTNIDFNGVVTMPDLDSNSFWGYEEVSGGFVWGWGSPYEAGMYDADGNDTYGNSTIYEEEGTSLYGMIDLYSNDTFVGNIRVKLPTQLSIMYVPKNAWDLAKTISNSAKVGLRIRTNDGQNTYCSTYIPIDRLKKSNKKVVVVPLN